MKHSSFGKIKILRLFFVLFFLTAVFPAAIQAKSSEWVSPDYNFKGPKSVWVKTPVFFYEYEGFNLDGRNKTVNYPDAEKKVDAIINDKIKKAENLFVFEKNIDSSQEQKEKSMLVIEDEEYADLILTIKIMDFGWLCEYYPPYMGWGNVSTWERYRFLDSRGNVHEGLREINRYIPVYYPEGYRVIDSVAAEFLLTDTKTGKVVWKYFDKRERASRKAGPEAMLKRIFEAAFNKMSFK